VEVVSYVPIADAMRERVISYHDEIGRPLRGSGGLATLETQAGLAPSRARLLLGVIRRQRGDDDVSGLDVAEVGAGFGALALWLALHGARVTAVEPDGVRSSVGRAIAEEHGLQIAWRRATAERAELAEESQDVIILNNTLCYLLEGEARTLALTGLLRATRRGGQLVVREPNRMRLVDPFSGLPLVHFLGPEAAQRAAQRIGRRRSAVRIATRGALRRELRRAAWEDVRLHPTGSGAARATLAGFTRHVHVAASRRQLDS
jgi:SAM-dependent methyltransferase